ncbi:MAG: hypothetical protein AAGI88_20560, partial [Pseudomonadota bacterium]
FDFAMISPLLRKMGILGTIDGREGLELQRDFLTSFFNKYLKSADAPLIEGRQKHRSNSVSIQYRIEETQ